MEDITPLGSIAPVYLLPLTEKEIAEREQWVIESEQQKQEQQAKEEARISALEKLAKLGLTEEEAQAIAGV